MEAVETAVFHLASTSPPSSTSSATSAAALRSKAATTTLLHKAAMNGDMATAKAALKRARYSADAVDANGWCGTSCTLIATCSHLIYRKRGPFCMTFFLLHSGRRCTALPLLATFEWRRCFFRTQRSGMQLLRTRLRLSCILHAHTTWIRYDVVK